MKLTAEQIQSNWEVFLNNIETLDDNECMLGSGVVDATVLNHRRQVAGLNDLVKKLIN